jgi:hypothetical protein
MWRIGRGESADHKAAYEAASVRLADYADEIAAWSEKYQEAMSQLTALQREREVLIENDVRLIRDNASLLKRAEAAERRLKDLERALRNHCDHDPPCATVPDEGETKLHEKWCALTLGVPYVTCSCRSKR